MKFLIIDLILSAICIAASYGVAKKISETELELPIYFPCALVVILSFLVFIYKFSFSSEFSTDMQDWGAYATCLASITSCVSIVLIYKTYKKQSDSYAEQTKSFEKQQNELKRQIEIASKTEFDNLFVHLLQTQRELYRKTNPDIFFKLHNYVIITIKELGEAVDKTSFRKTNSILYARFFRQNKKSEFTNKDINNLKNYFKHLYHIVSYVNKSKCFGGDCEEKDRYMGLIQAQMSIDELFCYMINVMDYYYRVDGKIASKENEGVEKAYINILFRCHFFEDLFRKKPAIELNDKLYNQLNTLYFNEFDFDNTLCEKGSKQNYELKPFEP